MTGGITSRFGRLGARMALLLSATLLPLGLILMVQISAVQREAMGRSEAALTGVTLRAGATLIRQLEEVRGATEALSAMMPELADDLPACIQIMQRVVARFDGMLAFAGFIPNDGRLQCSSAGQPQDLPMSDLRRDMIADPRPRVTMSLAGPISGESVIVISDPVYDGAGVQVGYVALSMPHRALAPVELSEGDPDPIELITFDAEGNLLSASSGLEQGARRLPANVALKALAGDRSLALRSVSASGVDRIFSVTPIMQGTLYLLGSWRLEDVDDMRRLGGLPAWLFAGLMWAASLGTALFGAERLVSRHIRALGRSMAAFAAGDRRVDPPDLRQAPTELQAVGEAYARLTAAIVRDEAELENMLRHKDVLLREVHHRVKNNLQLIASIMNMQMRKAHTPEARGLLKSLQDRVMSLATVHRELYQTSGLVDIRADELLADITRQVIKMGSSRDRQFSVHTAFDPVVLSPDQAVPLALLMTEALTNAMKYAGPSARHPARLWVGLADDGSGQAVLKVANSLPDPDMTTPPAGIGIDPPSGLGTQLLTAFAQQLQGQLRTAEEDGQYILTLSFTPHRDSVTEPPHSPPGIPGEEG